MTSNAIIYLRRNGTFGSSCDGCLDTGHVIEEDSGFFTVYDHDGEILVSDATRASAEKAIADDWRKPS